MRKWLYRMFCFGGAAFLFMTVLNPDSRVFLIVRLISSLVIGGSIASGLSEEEWL